MTILSPKLFSHPIKSTRGFTLVEMIISIALFAVVVLISVGALLSLISANRKAQALQSVMNNLNVTVDGMVRNVRMGNTYHCGDVPVATSQDCPNGDVIFAMEPYGVIDASQNKQWVYRFVAKSGTVSGHIDRSQDAGTSWVTLTAPEVNVTNMKFYVTGSTSGDQFQPRTVIIIEGIAGVTSVKTTTTFHIQATAVQRVLDI